MSTVHTLKTWPEHFGALLDGSKTFELRRDDRDFAVGDALVLREWVPDPKSGDGGRYTGRSLDMVVTHILRRDSWGALASGWCILSVKERTP